MIHKTLHRNLKIERTRLYIRVNYGAVIIKVVALAM
jgi:hypothetical protein